MTSSLVTLEDKYRLDCDRIFVTGIQALVASAADATLAR